MGDREVIADLLSKEQQNGLEEAVRCLSSFTADTMSIAAGGLAKTSKKAAMANKDTAEAQASGAEGDDPRNFFLWMIEDAADLVRNDRTIQKSTRALGSRFSIDEALTLGSINLTKVFTGAFAVENFFPIIGPAIKGAKGMHALTVALPRMASDRAAVRAASKSLNSGYPGEAFKAFERFVDSRIALLATNGAYKVGTALSELVLTLLVPVAAAPIKLAHFVADCLQLAFEYLLKVVEAFLFSRASDRMRRYAEQDRVPDPDTFRNILVGCPMVGCLFFACSNVFGKLSLTALIADPDKIQASGAVDKAMGDMEVLRQKACRLLIQSNTLPVLRAEAKDGKYRDVITEIQGYAAPKLATDLIIDGGAYKQVGVWVRGKRGKVMPREKGRGKKAMGPNARHVGA